MLKILLINSFLFLSITLSAQFGLTYSYTNQSYENWSVILREYNIEQIDKTDSPGRLHSIGLDYSFRPQTLRIEIIPQLGFSYSNSKLKNTVTLSLAQLIGNRISFDLNSQVYLFDLEGECDCPTFSKSAPFWKKGFYIKLGLGYYLEKVNLSPLENGAFLDITYLERNYKMNIGLGIDFGLSETLSISPSFLYSIHGSVDPNQLLGQAFFDSNFQADPQKNIGLKSLEFGLKLSYFFR